MSSPPPLTDRSALALHRARHHPGALFLHDQAAAEIKDRVDMVNRSFRSTAVVTGHPRFWQEQMPDATIVDDAETLPFTEQAHDLVIHAMCLHWANDPVGQIIQCRRVLKQDGLFLCVTPGGRTLHELRAVLTQTETDLRGGLSPRVAPMADLRDLGALLQRAGLALPVADSINLPVEYSDLFHLMRDLRGMGETNVLTARDRTIPPRSFFPAAAAAYAEAYPAQDGRIAATFELVCLAGWAPSDDQPKPLRPGSAKARLADALATREHPLSD